MVALLWLAWPSSLLAQQSGDEETTEELRLQSAAAAIEWGDPLLPLPPQSEAIEAQFPAADRALVISEQEAAMETWQLLEPQRIAEPLDLSRFWEWPLSDAAALARGMASEVAIMAAGGGAVLLITARHDVALTSDLTDLEREPSRLLVRIVEEFGNVRAVRPFAGAVFLGTLMTDNHRLQDAAFTSFEAVVLANLITSGLKTAFGRARPFQNEGAMSFRPLSGNTSFPSGHATTAFAFVTPWLLYYPNAITPGLVVLGAGTAFTRMITHNHWFTDVVAGSAIGFATAYVLTKRHQAAYQRIQMTPTIGPDQIGFSLSLAIP